MLTRRSVLCAAALAAPAIGTASRAASGRSVTVLAYAGLIPPAFKRQFEAETGIEIRIQPQFSQAPELNLLLSERERPTADLCTVAGSRLHQFHENAVIAPLDTVRLRNWERVDRAYREGAWLRVGGAVMGLPLTMSCERLVTNLDFAKSAAESWGDMFESRFRGRATYVIEDMLTMTMLWQGADPTFASYLATPERAQIAVNAARDQLIRTKSQVVKYYEDGAELVQMLTGEDAWIAQFYAGAPTKLVLDGLNYAMTVPREGSLGSVYNFGLVRNGPNADNAYRLLDALLADPGIGAAMTRASGYPSCFSGAETALSDVERRAFLLSQDELQRIRIRGFEGQALNSKLIDRAVEEVKAG